MHERSSYVHAISHFCAKFSSNFVIFYPKTIKQKKNNFFSVFLFHNIIDNTFLYKHAKFQSPTVKNKPVIKKFQHPIYFFTSGPGTGGYQYEAGKGLRFFEYYFE